MTDICGAKTKATGEPCRRPRGWGASNTSGRCKFHGGASPRGPAHAQWRHGMYSKYGTHDGQDVQAILESLDPDEELASVEGEVLYYVARLSAWIERNRGAWTLDQLGQVSILLERLSTIKQRHQRLQIQRAALIERSVVRVWIEHVRHVAEEYIKDERALEAFTRRVSMPKSAGFTSGPR